MPALKKTLIADGEEENGRLSSAAQGQGPEMRVQY
jgi:hypothetical protein